MPSGAVTVRMGDLETGFALKNAVSMGGPYAVDEAFCVVFRRDGPYYDLPAVLQTETYRLHLVLVDLAPAPEIGRQRRDKPVQIPVEEFLSAAPDASGDTPTTSTD